MTKSWHEWALPRSTIAQKWESSWAGNLLMRASRSSWIWGQNCKNFTHRRYQIWASLKQSMDMNKSYPHRRKCYKQRRCFSSRNNTRTPIHSCSNSACHTTALWPESNTWRHICDCVSSVSSVSSKSSISSVISVSSAKDSGEGSRKIGPQQKGPLGGKCWCGKLGCWNVGPPKAQTQLYNLSDIWIWLILRCWGKSSMVCQQKSDAL